MEGAAFSAPFPSLGSGNKNKTVHLMYKEGEGVAAYPETTDVKVLYFVLWTGRQPGCLCPGEVASDVTFPKRGQDLCAKSSLHGGEAGSGSDPGLLLASLLPSSQVSVSQQPGKPVHPGHLG